MTPFALGISRFISENQLLTPDSRVLVGLSGGADSAALLAVMCELGYECVALHCHFGLRGDEAERDLEHSRRLAERLGCKFFFRRFDTRSYMALRGISVEMACRELRYDAFAETAAAQQCRAIAVGHHREDNVETLLLNLLRGCGIHGVRGMEPRRDNIVRPLLETSKSEILEYLALREIEYVSDSTNFVADVARNRLRLNVLPALRKEFPNADAMLAKSLRNLRGCESLYNSLLPDCTHSLEGVGETLLLEWLTPYGFNPTQCHDILRSESGAEFVSAAWRLTHCPGRKFEIQRLGETPERPVLKGVICPYESNFRPLPGVLYLDSSASDDATWELRPWRNGDRMKPFGMSGYRMVSDILADAGISASRRRSSYVLTRNGEILWVVGVRASAFFPITENTTEFIEISCHEKI